MKQTVQVESERGTFAYCCESPWLDVTAGGDLIVREGELGRPKAIVKREAWSRAEILGDGQQPADVTARAGASALKDVAS